MTDSPLLHILFVDDEAPFREVMADRLTDQGFRVEHVGSGEAALERLNDFAFDILITDLVLPGGIDGRQVLDEARARYPEILALVITGHASVKEAIEVTRKGAAGFITKPFPFDVLLYQLRIAIERRTLKAENEDLRAQLHEKFRIEGMIGRAPVMLQLFELLRTVARTSSTVLITGETGTGKELAARAIHDGSARASQRFVAINCSAIPETLLEAELFGHVRGAFTGAVASRQGRIEQANRGTLFLDEVGTMSPALQAKLLRVLQNREFERVGDSQTVRVDVRVARSTLSRSVQQRGHAAPRPRDALAGGAAGADGLRLAGQRAAARERDGARVRAVAGPGADSPRRSAGRTARRRTARRGAGAGHSRDGHRHGAARVGLRASADPTGARDDERQQASGGGSPARQAHDAHREVEAAGAALMPSRHTYWVILAGTTPTSFRADRREELLPTLHQLQRTQPDVTLRWFARGRLWASPIEANEALKAARRAPRTRTGAWRPGGTHKDPKARYQLTRDQKRARFRQRRAGPPKRRTSGPPRPKR
jgi:CheY-like chemotaxis protein